MPVTVVRLGHRLPELAELSTSPAADRTTAGTDAGTSGRRRRPMTDRRDLRRARADGGRLSHHATGGLGQHATEGDRDEGNPRAAAIGATPTSATSRTNASGLMRARIGARSRCITGPTAHREEGGEQRPPPVRHRELHDAHELLRRSRPAIRRRIPAADHSNPIAATRAPPSGAVAHCTSCPRLRIASANGTSALMWPAPPSARAEHPPADDPPGATCVRTLRPVVRGA